MSLKIAVIGGGSSYTPELIDGFIKRKHLLPVHEIWLVDIPEGQEKMNIVAALSQRMLDVAGLKTKVVTTLERRKAIEGADFVVTQFRVGGMAARAMDESIPLEFGVIGQETTGPGGFAKARRTIPKILEICRDIEEYGNDPWLINFTNPSGIVTEAVLKHTHVKTIGLCNVPIHMKNNLARILNVQPDHLQVDFMGLNHLVWGTRVYNQGTDITTQALDALKAGHSFSMQNIPDMAWDPNLIEALGMIPCPYHRYFYTQKDLLEEELNAFNNQGTRAQVVMKVEEELFKKYADPALNEKPSELESRGGAYYSDAAVSLISAIYNDENSIHTVDILNNGTITNLPDDIVIEANAIIGRRGARGLTLGAMPDVIHGLVSQVKAYEKLTIESVVENNRDKAVMALTNHPLVPDFKTAKQLEEELFTAESRRKS